MRRLRSDLGAVALEVQLPAIGKALHVKRNVDKARGSSRSVAIRACKEDAPNAVRFSKPEGVQKAQIKISNATVVDMVRKLMDWTAEDNWNVPGIYFADEQGIMYALESAYAPRAKGGWAARREREAAAALAESSIDSEEVDN